MPTIGRQTSEATSKDRVVTQGGLELSGLGDNTPLSVMPETEGEPSEATAQTDRRAKRSREVYPASIIPIKALIDQWL